MLKCRSATRGEPRRQCSLRAASCEQSTLEGCSKEAPPACTQAVDKLGHLRNPGEDGFGRRCLFWQLRFSSTRSHQGRLLRGRPTHVLRLLFRCRHGGRGRRNQLTRRGVAWDRDLCRLAAMIARGGSSLLEIFLMLAQSGYLGAVNGEVLSQTLGKNDGRLPTLAQDVNDSRSELAERKVPPHHRSFGFILPHGPGSSTGKPHLAQRRALLLGRFREISRRRSERSRESRGNDSRPNRSKKQEQQQEQAQLFTDASRMPRTT